MNGWKDDVKQLVKVRREKTEVKGDNRRRNRCETDQEWPDVGERGKRQKEITVTTEKVGYEMDQILGGKTSDAAKTGSNRACVS